MTRARTIARTSHQRYVDWHAEVFPTHGAPRPRPLTTPRPDNWAALGIEDHARANRYALAIAAPVPCDKPDGTCTNPKWCETQAACMGLDWGQS